MQIDNDFMPPKDNSLFKIIIPIVIWGIIIGIIANYVRDRNQEAAANKDVIRCIIDENATNLNSPACKRVINICSNDKTGSCKKLLFYSDDGVHSEGVLSILGNICSKGGEKACDILIKRCIENSSNCEILGKSYSIKNYLAMKFDSKNTGKSVMYKKLKNYYDKDVDNIVSKVIQTCMTDKNSMACQIFTSKVYDFNTSEKPYFLLSQNSNSEIEFSEKGISLALPKSADTESRKNEEESSYNTDSDKNYENAAEAESNENKQNYLTQKIIPIANKDKLNNTQAVIKAGSNNPKSNFDKSAVETPANTGLSSDIAETNTVLTKKQAPDVIFKSLLTTGEENNIDYIKNKIYSFDISYKEPANTKIKWLVSFDGRATWKKWDGNSWVQANTDSGLENINFSIIGNNSAEIIKGLKDYTLQNGETSLDFAVELISPDETSTPSLNKVEIKYY